MKILNSLPWFALLLITGLVDGSNSSATNKSSDSGMKVVMVLLGLVALAAFSVFLYRLWQRKKREEQHARLLKLFEQDDELEVELGIRD